MKIEPQYLALKYAYLPIIKKHITFKIILFAHLPFSFHTYNEIILKKYIRINYIYSDIFYNTKNNKNNVIKGKNMRYNDQTLNPELVDSEIIPNIDDVDKGKDKQEKAIKAHVVRRNVEDYLERKALERSLKEVFDDDYLLD